VHGQSVAAMVEGAGWSTGCLLIAIIGKRYATYLMSAFLGFRGKVARTTLADANESRDWRIFAYNGGHKVHSSLLNVARLSGVRHPLT
jgi:hypothetical protein